MVPAALTLSILLAAAPPAGTSTQDMADIPGRFAPTTIRMMPRSAQDSIITGVCEAALTPIGVILPAGAAATACGAPLVLRHGWRDGDPGTYVFLDLPACPDSWCRTLQTSDRLRCEILIGNPCCYLQDLQGKEVPAITGARIGPIRDALRSRFDADTDRRNGLCHDLYLGNEARVLRVLIVESAGKRGRNTYRILGGGRLYLRERQESDEITGEMIPVPPPE
jgi:hypothetical protein